jgi:hypothetical protein
MNRFLPSIGMERTTTLELQKNKESLKRIFKDVWSKGNMEVLDEVVAPTFKRHQYDRAQQRNTTKEVLEGIESMEKGWIRTRPDNRILDKGLKQVREP